MLLQINPAGFTTKNRIVALLSKRWPLTTKQILDSLKKEYRTRITYQAVYFSLGELAQQGILLKDGKQYLLNPVWIERTATDFNSLIESYTRHNRITTAKDFQELNFGTPGEAWEFLLSRASSEFFGKAPSCYVQVARLFAFPLATTHAEQIAAFAKTTKVVLLCRRDGPIERLAANYLRSLGITVHLGVACAHPNNVALIGKSVIDIYVLYSKETTFFDRFYASVKDILKQDVFATFSRFMSDPTKVKLTINRNPEVYQNILELTEKLIPASALPNPWNPWNP